MFNNSYLPQLNITTSKIYRIILKLINFNVDWYKFNY